MPKVLALNSNGQITYCSVPPELRGVGRCNHIEHQNPGEPAEDFIERINEKQSQITKSLDNKQTKDKMFVQSSNEIGQSQINAYAARIDEIAGEKVTPENFHEVMSRLTPEQIAEISRVGFDAAPEFSLPIADERYEDENMKNKLYFANLPAYGIAGNKDAIAQMFDKVGSTPTLDGPYEIDRSYREGLTPHQYFQRQFSSRDAMINKSVGTAKPGFTARKLFYCMSDTQVVKDCGGEHTDALHCSMPEGHICEKCAHATHGGENVKEGQNIGGWVSTNMSEALTQLSMKQKHLGSAQGAASINVSHNIMATLDGYSTSPIIQKMREAKTTEEARDILYNGLKEQYKNAGIAQDDFNIQMVARKLTSYKRVPGEGLRPVKPGEKCDIVSMAVVGNNGNIFKTSELGSGYKHLTNPIEQDIKPDAANEILR